ncbi:carbohydrate esterase family 2 protein [Piromyces sp. E2]|nr:carbohydrate esterase family 2 protein [Piromyces sp. E2]|eukprot:OUM56238.1 carbohydrate esterase family 2 protein [Piromyces sp. E2]
MKFNVLLLVAIGSLTSAIPFKEYGNPHPGYKELYVDHRTKQPKVVELYVDHKTKQPKVSYNKNVNPYLVCKKFDIGCKVEQSKLCYDEVFNCFTANYILKYMDCIKLIDFCSDIWLNNNNNYKPTPTPNSKPTSTPTPNTNTNPILIPTPIPINSEPVINSFEPTKENVKIIGRAKYMDNSLWVGHTDSGIEFKMNGKSVSIVVSTDSVYGSSGKYTPARLLVFGDGNVVVDAVTTENPTVLNVEFEEAGEHIVRLLKTSECQDGSVYIDEIKTDSQVISPTPSKDRKIEFIGDSITCGVGALEKDCEYYSTSADGINLYAYKVAQKLNADYSIFSFGGFGVYSGFRGEPVRKVDITVPVYYEKLGRLNWNFDHPENTTTAISSIDWDPTEFEPDLIIVNLGTNDAFYINSLSEDLREGEQINFIHPNAEILCTIGMMGQFLYQEIENAVTAYVNETHDAKVNAFLLSEDNIEKNGPGFYGHPSILSHIDAANEIIIRFLIQMLTSVKLF